jgi:hypothetical protein
MYECETWPLTKRGKRTCIDVILEQGADENPWIQDAERTVGRRKLRDEELHSYSYLLLVIKSNNIRWSGHVVH